MKQLSFKRGAIEEEEIKERRAHYKVKNSKVDFFRYGIGKCEHKKEGCVFSINGKCCLDEHKEGECPL